MQRSKFRKSLAFMLAVMMVLSALLPTVAFAESENGLSDELIAAQALYEAGLLRGVGTDEDGYPIFALDEQVTRLQGKIMSLRFIGAYERAQARNYGSPFTDVGGQYNRAIVGYGYQRGITKGVSETRFDPTGDLTASMFITFMLRALGFIDGVDFAWNTAWTLSDELGITDGEFYAGNNSLLRSSMALIALFTLEQYIVSSEQTLLELLVELDVLSEDDEELILEAIRIIRGYEPQAEAAPAPAPPAQNNVGGGDPGGGAPGGGAPGDTPPPSDTTPPGDDSEDDPGDDEDPSLAAFEAARAAALEAIADANLPTAAMLYGKSIVVPGMDILTHRFFSNTENISAAEGGITDYTFDPYMIPFTEWPAVGIPAIESALGNAAATGIYALIEAMLYLAPDDFDFEADEYFSGWRAFDELYRPAAIAGTPVVEKQVYILAGNEAALRITYPEDVSDFFVPHRIYQRAVIVGGGPETNLRVANYILAANPPGAPPFGSGILHEHLGRAHGLYDFRFNSEGVVISFVSRSLIDFTFVGDFTPAAAASGIQGTIRIGQYRNNLFEVASGAQLYTITTGAGATITPSDWSILSGLLGENGHGTIRPVFDENGRVIEAYFIAAGNVNPGAAQQRWAHHLGVRPDEPGFEFDAIENPNPVEFALYDPRTDALHTGTGNATAATLFPLFIYFHGSGAISDGTATFATNGGGNFYTLPAQQAQFETNTPGVNAAFVMSPRSHRVRTSSLYGAQDWVTGFRAGLNPRYQYDGDPTAYGRNTQAAAIVQNVRWLLANYPIDPNRVYLTGHSAGGHQALNVMFASVRLGYPNLFAAIVPSQSAFFPALNRFPAFDADLRIADGGPELGVGLQSWLEATAHIPHWMQAARNDGTCRWGITAGDDFELWRRVGDLTGPANGGLTRVSIVVDEKNDNGTRAGQHAGTQLHRNNMFVDNLWHNGTEHVITDTPSAYYVRLDFMDRVFAEQPDGWQEAFTTATTWRPAGAAAINGDVNAARAHLFSFGKYPQYSSNTDWAGSLVQWLNAAGRFRAGLCFEDIDKAVPSPTFQAFMAYEAILEYTIYEEYCEYYYGKNEYSYEAYILAGAEY